MHPLVLVLTLSACASSTKPGTTTPPPLLTLADHTTPLCNPAPLTGTFPTGSSTIEATLTLDGIPTHLTLDPGLDGAFAIDFTQVDLTSACTPQQAPCTLDARLAVLLDGDTFEDTATLNLTDQGTLLAFPDADGDGHGDETASAQAVCPGTHGYVETQDDCNDNAAAINPNADEVCGIDGNPNGIDEDCDTLVDNDDVVTNAIEYYLDRDDDNSFDPTPQGQCATPSVAHSETLTGRAIDCDDLDPTRSGDDADLDTNTTCDANPDCDDNNIFLHTLDLDGDSLTSCDGDCADDPSIQPAAASIAPGNSDAVDDGIDQDCDGVDTCYLDQDGDTYSDGTLTPPGFGTPVTDLAAYDASTGAVRCDDAPPTGSPSWTGTLGDCDDLNPDAFPTNSEVIGDGIDQDCNDLDSCFPDADNDNAPDSLGATSADSANLTLFETCASIDSAAPIGPVDCDSGDSTVFPGAAELAGDDVDQNCDGLEDCYIDGDNDNVPPALTVVTGVVDTDAGQTCTTIDYAAPAPVGDLDCNDANSAFVPGATENVGDPDYGCDAFVRCYTDADNDNFGTAPIVNSIVATPGELSNCVAAADVAPVLGDCADADPDQFPTAPEIACDGIQQDCDGARPDARVAILDGQDELALFSNADQTFNGTPAQQLTDALLASVPDDVIRLCGTDTYTGSFSITEPIVLQGVGATLNGGFETNNWTTCPSDGPHRVLLIDGIGLGGQSVVLEDLLVTDGCVNTTGPDSRGGGIDVIEGANLTLTDVVLDDNHAEFGGGLAVRDNSTVVWTRGEAQDHTARRGAAAWVEFGSSLEAHGTPTTQDFSWFDNEADDDGGAIYAIGNLTLSSCSFEFSDAVTGDGGAIYAGGATTNLTECSVDGSAGGDGGAIYAGGATTNLTECSLSGDASSSGDAIYIAGDVDHTVGSLAGDGATAALAAYVSPGAAYNFTCVQNDDADVNITLPGADVPDDQYMSTYRNGVTSCDDELCTELAPDTGALPCP